MFAGQLSRVVGSLLSDMRHYDGEAPRSQFYRTLLGEGHWHKCRPSGVGVVLFSTDDHIL